MEAVVAGAAWAVGGVLAVMGASSVVFLTAVHDLHLNAWSKENQTTMRVHNYS